MAWLVLTRADIAVYVQALQRRGMEPRAVDCKPINLVTRYLWRHEICIRYQCLPHPVKIVGFSDAAFKVQIEESSGLALRGLATILVSDGSPFPDSKNGRCQLLEFFLLEATEASGTQHL